MEKKKTIKGKSTQTSVTKCLKTIEKTVKNPDATSKDFYSAIDALNEIKKNG